LPQRDRALEAILSRDDHDAELAERYGWVTRAMPDAELETAYGEFLNSLTWPGFQARVPGFGKLTAELGADEAERHLGRYLDLANQQA
jgi:hypothetical protein